MTREQYHKDTTRISKSGLDLINRSPYHYWYKFFSGREAQKEPDYFKLGRAFHKAVLEPGSFFDEYAVAPDVDRRFKDGKEEYEKFVLSSNGKAILSYHPEKQNLGYNQILQMQESVMRCRLAKDLLSRPGVSEQIIFWTCPETGAKCRQMVDRITEDQWIIDIKSTTDSSLRAVENTIFKYRYDVQAAFYQTGFEVATGVKPKGFVFFFTEKQPPYITEPYFLSSEILAAAKSRYLQDLEVYQKCLEKGEWGTYNDSIITQIS